MQVALDYIERKKHEFSRGKFFQYLREAPLEPRKKLVFSACLSPSIMGLRELNQTIFRNENSSDPLQDIVNQYTSQNIDDWLWRLEALGQIGLYQDLTHCHSLTLMWRNKQTATRQLVDTIFDLTYQCYPLQTLITIQTIDAVESVVVEVTTPFVQALAQNDEERYFDIGQVHRAIHAKNIDPRLKLQGQVDNLQLTHTQRAEQLQVIDQIFSAFTTFLLELLTFAQTNPMQDFLDIEKYLYMRQVPESAHRETLTAV